MEALQELEVGGYVFDVKDDDRLTYRHAPREGWPLSEQPPEIQEIVGEWAAPLLAEIQSKRAAVIQVLRARLEWESVWDDWCAAAKMQQEELLLDRDECQMANLRYMRRLNELSIAAKWPFYNGGPVDQGEQGWMLYGTQLMREALDVALGDGRTKAEPDRGGPLMPCYEPQVTVSLENSQNKENKAMGIRIEQTKFEVLPVGEYRVKILDVSEAEGKFGPQLQFKVQVSDGPHAGAELLSWCSRTFSPKSKLYQWVESALAVPIPKEYTLDTDTLIGREALATVMVRELDGGGEANRVERVRAVREIQRVIEL
jgi:hypothetical protein